MTTGSPGPTASPTPAATGAAAPASSAATATARRRPPVATVSTPGGRLDDLVLAGVHLRLGSLALARAEFEALAGRDALDEAGLVDLAEARWRTGDLAGAGEAAQAALDGEDGPVIALLIAAESAAARGRPTEARRFAARAMEGAGDAIDRIFAGMPRSAVWPADPAAPPPSPTTMFHAPASPGGHGGPTAAAGAGAGAAATPTGAVGAGAVAAGVTAPAGASVPGLPSGGGIGVTLAGAATASHVGGGGPGSGPAAVAAVGAAGFWDLPIESSADEFGEARLPSADDELAGGRAALTSGDTHEAAVRLALVLRLTPALAPAVLDLVSGRGERELALVRGDAYRLVGRELEARRAYADAAHPRQAVPGDIAHTEVAPAAWATDDVAPDAGVPTMHEPDVDPPPAEGDPA